ncbi:MAG TPA: hypothetical protein VGF82_30030 [Terracidiphilus sp.]
MAWTILYGLTVQASSWGWGAQARDGAKNTCVFDQRRELEPD